MVLLPLHINLNSSAMAFSSVGRHPITEVLSAVASQTAVDSVAVVCQRFAGLKGAVQVSFSSDPTGITGTVYLEGRMGPGSPWGVLANGTTHPELDISTYSSSTLSQIAKDVPILPEVRISHDPTGAAAGTMTVTIME